ncbi:hypothetical protein [Lentzea xinjiangensis]|uniref:hypothetical protein n=1 Tax=Lentzea xinjiangensis TaxID=402600 RepID=UPI0015A6DC8E|nr:hypothetical protein [Lentzea xinjiangensis]
MSATRAVRTTLYGLHDQPGAELRCEHLLLVLSPEKRGDPDTNHSDHHKVDPHGSAL